MGQGARQVLAYARPFDPAARTDTERPIREATSQVFNLSGYTVHEAARRIVVAIDPTEGACHGAG